MGIGLAVFVSMAAGYVADWFGVSVLGFAKSPVSAIMMAIVLGMLVANTIKLPESIQPGLKFCTSAIRKQNSTSSRSTSVVSICLRYSTSVRT